mmetsp:Transcript_2673/g.2958  ORF Transcript_2673/g.2958 Transcript_2673/m.2958 type:complete len:307 (+) Transcript_2673:113-1033(+)
MMAEILKAAILIGIINVPCFAFQAQSYHLHCDNIDSIFVKRNTVTCHATRRDAFSFLVPTSLATIAFFVPNGPSLALSDYDNGKDLTSKMFNSDGSLKEGIESEVKYRDVSFKWDQSDEMATNKDGDDENNSKSGSQYKFSYQYPMRWSNGKDGDPIYFDRSEGINRKAAKGITIYQAPGKANIDRLQKATTVGVAKAIDVPKEFSRLYKADVVSGRTIERGSQKYYEFDMAAAPDTCGDSKENLGLGFCPYDDLFLLSATVVNDRLYCMVVECDNTKIWKVESKELKRIRSTFTIEEAEEATITI